MALPPEVPADKVCRHRVSADGNSIHWLPRVGISVNGMWMSLNRDRRWRSVHTDLGYRRPTHTLTKPTRFAR